MPDERETGWLGDAHGGPCPTPPPLPDGIRRAEGCPERLTIEQAREIVVAVRVHGGGLHKLRITADETPKIRPAPRERIRDLRPGDLVRFATSGAPGKVEWVELVG